MEEMELTGKVTGVEERRTAAGRPWSLVHLIDDDGRQLRVVFTPTVFARLTYRPGIGDRVKVYGKDFFDNGGMATGIEPVKPERTMAELVADLGQIVASAESDLDDTDYPDPQATLETLIYRVRVAAGLIDEAIEKPGANAPMVGRNDRCLITVEHDHSFCGKPGAHR